MVDLLTNTTPRSSTERYKGIVMSVDSVLWKEPVGIKVIWIWVDVGASVELESTNHNSTALRQDYALGHCG